jgi:hypothetical protein
MMGFKWKPEVMAKIRELNIGSIVAPNGFLEDPKVWKRNGCFGLLLDGGSIYIDYEALARISREILRPILDSPSRAKNGIRDAVAESTLVLLSVAHGPETLSRKSTLPG